MSLVLRLHSNTLTTEGRPTSAHSTRTSKLTWALIAVLAVLNIALALPAQALDLVTFSGITGPLTSALTQISALGPGIKALVGFIGFVVALISLSALRKFSPVLFYVGLAIFGAVGLVIAGAIMGAVL